MFASLSWRARPKLAITDDGLVHPRLVAHTGAAAQRYQAHSHHRVPPHRPARCACSRSTPSTTGCWSSPDGIWVPTRWTSRCADCCRLCRPAGKPLQATVIDSIDHRIGRPVTAVGRGGGDRVDDLLRLGVDDLAEDGVLAVQVRRLADGDEELRAVGARAPRWPSPAGTACRTAARGGTRRRTRSRGRRGRCRSGRRPGS